MRTFYFVVGGCGAFPFKLMAIDKAFPASEADAVAIEYACPTTAPFVRVRLASAFGPPNPTRWRDAKWPVESIE
jgi:hypothetical protein